MKIYILTDLEGAAGVSRFSQTREVDSPEKAVAKTLLTGEVNAAAEGIRSAHPDAEIICRDGQGNGGINFTELHRDVKLIPRGGGLPPYLGMDESFDALFFVGQHTMSLTPNGVLAHTGSSKTVEYVRINGVDRRVRAACRHGRRDRRADGLRIGLRQADQGSAGIGTVEFKRLSLRDYR